MQTNRAGTDILASIDAPHFYCGIVLTNDVVTQTAPIVGYMRGWTRDRVRSYCQRKRWKVTVVAPLADSPQAAI